MRPRSRCRGGDMSGWILITRALHDIGGGPVRFSAIEWAVADQERPRSALRRAQEMGTIVRAGKAREWLLTDLGRDLCLGRAKVIGLGCRGKTQRIVHVLGETPDDGWIEGLLMESGHKPGHAITPAVLRRYSAALVAVARSAA